MIGISGKSQSHRGEAQDFFSRNSKPDLGRRQRTCPALTALPPDSGEFGTVTAQLTNEVFKLRIPNSRSVIPAKNPYSEYSELLPIRI